ncbi:GGDEF domain-containing protein [Roseovarius faecimaris]|uniref:GGDEF domain-containing protein n=1 Tax=Roseovarius faecimaris TaxID=2494550 RepID=A0A6I6IKH9_9RHOB|nr:GGDEF domain-containing protein [Roseovarius faecimaris]
MRLPPIHLTSKIKDPLLQYLPGPHIYALLPALILAGFWLGGEPVLVACAILLPLSLALSGRLRRAIVPTHETDGFVGMDILHETLDKHMRQARGKLLKAACILVEIDDYDAIVERFGRDAAQRVSERTYERLCSIVRNRDSVFMLNDACIAVSVAPVRRLDLDVGLQLAVRMQAAVEEPIALDATTVYVSACVGFCISTQIVDISGKSLAGAARLALQDARCHGPSAIRCYTSGMRELASCAIIQSDEVTRAMESGQIQPWFQPQISTDDGKVTGFEALARWMHPERGVISPAEFMPVLEQSARMERLGEVVLYHALNALTSWDMQGIDVPHVGVNFSPAELRNPRLMEKVEWELDRFDLTPERLVVEILETVVATSPDDTVARNINGLSALGCVIDLDDFGTGHASISSIRRFAVQRIKIDRSFVMKVDQDHDQQRMVSAILLMAERLNLATLAEGVETAGEHTMLAQLGCGHVQGFGIGRPMPFDKTAAWIHSHATKLKTPPIVGRKFG